MKSSILAVLAIGFFFLTGCQKEHVQKNGALTLELAGAKNGGAGPETSIKSGLLFWYPFNGNANDASGNGSNGAVNGPTLTKDRYGRKNSAYYFSGGGDIRTSNAGPSGNPNTSVSFWMKTNTQRWGSIIGWGNNSTPSYAFHVSVNLVPGSIDFSTGGQNPVAYDNGISFANDYSTNTWSHYVVTYDGTLGANVLSASVYKNGLKMTTVLKSVVYPFATNIQNIPNMTIGGGFDISFPTAPFEGSLDDIRVYGRVLTAAEITYLAKNKCD